VNQIDWERKEKYSDVFEYFRKLIQLRKNHLAFKLGSTEKVSKYLNFCSQYQLGVVSYCIMAGEAGDPWKKIILHFNGKSTEAIVPLPEGTFRIVAQNGEIDENGLGELVADEIIVAPVSMTMLVEL
jgi:pullulanase